MLPPLKTTGKKIMGRRKKAQKGDRLRPGMVPGTAFPGDDKRPDHPEEGQELQQLHRFLLS